MTNLKQAAQQALEALEDFGMKHYENTGEVLHRDVYESLKAALAEPVEPVAWSHINGTSDTKWHPPQRKPLTEEEIDSIWDSEKAFADIYAIARAIERAHGIV